MRSMTTSRIVIAIATLTILGSPVLASDKSKLEAQGLEKLSHAQVAKIKIGKKIRGVSHPKKDKWTATYKKDGTKYVTWNGGKANLDWSFEGGKWCETIARKKNCSNSTYKLENTCYNFASGGKIRNTFKCK